MSELRDYQKSVDTMALAGTGKGEPYESSVADIQVAPKRLTLEELGNSIANVTAACLPVVAPDIFSLRGHIAALEAEIAVYRVTLETNRQVGKSINKKYDTPSAYPNDGLG